MSANCPLISNTGKCVWCFLKWSVKCRRSKHRLFIPPLLPHSSGMCNVHCLVWMHQSSCWLKAQYLGLKKKKTFKFLQFAVVTVEMCPVCTSKLTECQMHEAFKVGSQRCWMKSCLYFPLGETVRRRSILCPLQKGAMEDLQPVLRHTPKHMQDSSEPTESRFTMCPSQSCWMRQDKGDVGWSQSCKLCIYGGHTYIQTPLLLSQTQLAH